MSFCLNCSSHRPCDCAGPPPEVTLPKHPATKWFDQQVEEGNFPTTSDWLDVDALRHLMTKAFNAGACHACREIKDVLPQGPLQDCFRDEFHFAVQDVYEICREWLG